MAYLKFHEFIEKIDQLEEANILIAALEFKVFTILGKHGLSSQLLGRRAGLQTEGAEALLNALVSMGALKIVKNTYLNTSESFKHFCESSPHYKVGTVFLRKENRDEWSKLIDVMKNGRNLEDFENDAPEFREPFTYAMHERSQKFSKSLARFVTQKPVGTLMDIGGGPGSYSVEILKTDKCAVAKLVDRPASITVAKNILKNSSVIKRFNFIAGDLFELGFEGGNDTVLYSNILHIYNESENNQLLKKIHASLKPGGRLILVDFFLKNNRSAPLDAAKFSITMLLYTATGRTYTFKETETMLKKQGFGKFKRCNLGQGTSVIEAVKI